MSYYETTDTLTRKQADQFVKWFYEEIGTDHEENDGAEDGQFYLLFSDLTDQEVKKIRNYELANFNSNGAKP